jgi:hypothetical protein
MRYYIAHKDGKLLGVSNTDDCLSLEVPGVSFIEIEGTIPDLNRCTFDIKQRSLVSNSKKFTRLEFLSLFTLQERIQINSSEDPVVKDIIRLFDAADNIETTSSTTLDALNYLKSVNILTEDRLQGITNA